MSPGGHAEELPLVPAQALQLLPHHHQGPVGQAEAEARQGAGQALQGGHRLG